MVQISKGPIGTKGSRVTTYVSLPGRYLVFMPTVEHIGVSRRIPRDEERDSVERNHEARPPAGIRVHRSDSQ